MAALTCCSVCGRRVDAVEAWFHPGTGDTVCDRCLTSVHARNARLIALRGEYR